MGALITWALVIIGIILIVLSATLFKRKGEAEISSSITSVPTFKIGLALIIIGIIAKIVILFI